MRNRRNENDGLTGLQIYATLNAVVFLAAWYSFLPSRVPSEFDYDFQRYKNGEFPYGNSAFITARNLTLLLNMLGAVTYLIYDGCKSACARVPVPANPYGFFRDNPLSRGPMAYQPSTVRVEEVFDEAESESSPKMK